MPATNYIALLRGINVGGKHKLPMQDLAAMFAAAGASDVRTYIQSGNVLFTATSRAAASLPDQVERAIEARFGFRTPIVVRSSAELRDVSSDNPFATKGDGEGLHVGFLLTSPAPSRVATLDTKRSPPDRIAVRGKHVYFHLPNGVAKTRYTNAYLDSTLDTVCTLRNWRTVLTLVEMSGP